MPTVPLLASVADLTASITSGGASQLVPTGTVFPFAGSSAPTGWLLCNGQSVSQTTYAALYAALGGAASPYGGVSGGNFAVPDCRGIFIAGSGSQAVGGITYTRTHGSKQGDVLQGHKTEGVLTNANLGGDKAIYRDYALSGSSTANLWSPSSAAPTAGAFVTNGSVSATGNAYYVNAGIVTDGTNGTPRTGAETRPANIAMNYIIKT